MSNNSERSVKNFGEENLSSRHDLERGGEDATKVRCGYTSVGSLEQHGYHLPEGTDTLVAIELAEDVAEKTGAVVAPPVWFGWSRARFKKRWEHK